MKGVLHPMAPSMPVVDLFADARRQSLGIGLPAGGSGVLRNHVRKAAQRVAIHAKGGC
jgi:hypothetical protein